MCLGPVTSVGDMSNFTGLWVTCLPCCVVNSNSKKDHQVTAAVSDLIPDWDPTVTAAVSDLIPDWDPTVTAAVSDLIPEWDPMVTAVVSDLIPDWHRRAAAVVVGASVFLVVNQVVLLYLSQADSALALACCPTH